MDEHTEAAIYERYTRVAELLDERARRLLAATEALTVGRGGIATVARATGLSRDTIRRGMSEVEQGSGAQPGRIRRPGGGRKRTVDKDPGLVSDLERLVAPSTRGDPESPLRWTCKSVRRLAVELGEQGHQVSHQLVAELLHGLDYSLQANRKTREGDSHPDRDAQFAHINQTSHAFLAAGDPVISVDAKKKELVGAFKNGGREWQPQGTPEEVRVYDFVDRALGRATPYGIYDVAANTGWVNVGIDHDTAAFAVESIRRWWVQEGHARYPQATQVLITADGGGSNGARTRLWKRELQALADETGLAIHVCHFPPGTSKWNLIEHRLFSFISRNWRGKPLVSYRVILNLIAATATTAGLRVSSVLDTNTYPRGIKVSDTEMKTFRIARDAFQPDWNYTLLPRTSGPDVVIL